MGRMTVQAEPSRSRRGALGVVVAVATAVVLVSAAIVPFLTPAWIGWEQGRAQAEAWTGYSGPELRTATDSIVADLVLGPPDFDVAVRGEPVLNERERSHMRDVRGVFVALWALTAVSIAVLVGTFVASRRDRSGWFRSVGRGAAGLGIAVVGIGAVAAVAFEPLFELFHRLFFAGGTYTFDPTTERLVQLFPFTFWQETTIAVGAVIVALSLATWWAASRRARRGPVAAGTAAARPVAG